MRLQQVNATVPNSDIAPAPALDEHLRDESMRHIKLPLRPTLALRPRLFERQGLFVVDDRVMRPRRFDPLGERFHRELHVLSQARRAPTVFLEHVERDAHARPAEHRR